MTISSTPLKHLLWYNVISTGNGEAEEVIGRVVAEGLVPREDLTIVSKFGYIQGQNLERYNSGEVVTPDTVHVASYIKHCLHPDFM